jgi:hypothetical protein
VGEENAKLIRDDERNGRIPSWFEVASSGPVVLRALVFLVVVGGILVAINHGDALWRGDVDRVRMLKMILTPLVPYTVSTLSSVLAIRAQARAALEGAG